MEKNKIRLQYVNAVVSCHIKFILINDFLNSKVYMSRENKTFNGGHLRNNGKSHGSGNEKGHEFLNYRSSSHPESVIIFFFQIKNEISIHKCLVL